MGFASSPATRTALASLGVRVTGWTWRWALGLKGGTFPPHFDINGEHAPTADSFDALPGEDVNGDSCNCRLVPVYRTPDGRFARPGLQPVFQPPVIAAAHTHQHGDRFEVEQFMELVKSYATQPVNVTVRIPDSAIVVNVPEFPAIPVPNVVVEPTVVHVAAPSVTVDNPVTVEPTPITVQPPAITVDVKPAPVKIIREKILARKVRFRRNNDGRITEAEVTQ